MATNSILQQTIIEELGLQNLPEERKNELLAKMGEVIVKRIYLETMESLDEAGREELVKMLDDKAEQEKIESFLTSKIVNYEELVKKIVDGFRDEMKEAAGKFDEKYKE